MKDQWFAEYERLWNEREDSGVPETYKQSDTQLAERASAILLENACCIVDLERKRELEDQS